MKLKRYNTGNSGCILLNISAKAQETLYFMKTSKYSST
jgi:hypothetical protein